MDALLASSDVPQDAKLIVLILKSMGVTHYEPAVVVQLLEFTHRSQTFCFFDRPEISLIILLL